MQAKTGEIHYERKYSDALLLRLLEHRETGSWRQKQRLEHSGSVVYKTAAERKAAPAAADASIQKPRAVLTRMATIDTSLGKNGVATREHCCTPRPVG